MYTQVLRAVLATLPGRRLVSSCMVDFESTMWKALAHVFPDLPVKKGLCFPPDAGGLAEDSRSGPQHRIYGLERKFLR